MFLTHGINGRNTILNFLLLLDCKKAHFLRIYYFRGQHGGFIGAEEPELGHISTMVEVGESITSVQAEANTGMCNGYLKGGFMVVQIVFSHCYFEKSLHLFTLY